MTTTMTAGNAPTAPAPEAPLHPVRAALLVLPGSAVALLALPVIMFFGGSVAGWAIGAGLVFANALLHALVSWATRGSSVTVTLGAMGFSMIIRAGITALVLFFVGAEVSGANGDRTIGLNRPDIARVAIVVFLIGFTIDAFLDTLRRAAVRDAPSAATTVRETSV